MHSITLETEINFGTPRDRSRGEADLLDLLWWLVRCDVRYLTDFPNAPRLYEAGVRYQHEPPGIERWQAYDRLLVTKLADCEDLACARVAECIVRLGDTKAEPHFFSRPISKGARMYHIQCKRGDGTIEDPSAVLGMGQ